MVNPANTEILPIHNDAIKWLTPSLVEQTTRILSGKCPHNNGWTYDGHGHNEDAFKCNICGEIQYY